MKKKFWVYFATFICVIMFCILALVVFMMIAPGTSVFGVKYISIRVGQYDESKQVDISGDLYLQTYDLPVTVGFGSSGETIGVHLVQKYQGFTRSADVPGISIKNANGEEYESGSTDAAYVSINQYKKFVWANREGDAYVEIILPIYYSKGDKNVYINSTNSKITLEGANTELNNVSINTGNGVAINTSKLQINGKLTLNVNSGVTLGSNVTVNDVAINLNNATISIDNPVNGNVQLNTTSGNIAFMGCNGDATITTSSGSVSCNGDIGGDLKLTTTYGTVNMQKVGGDVNIYNASGAVTVGDIAGHAIIETKRSNIKVGNCGSCKITSNTGTITASSTTTGKFEASTTTGTITCGSVAGDAEVSSKTAAITFSGNIAGKAKITNDSGNIVLVSADNIELTTNTGAINAYTADGIKVTNDAIVKTSSGNITIKNIGGDATIDSNSGTINIDQIAGVAKINKNRTSSSRAAMTIGSAGSADINGLNYDVKLGSCGDTTITNINGSIVVGYNGTIGNLVAYSTYGDITATNVTGQVSIGQANKLTGGKVTLECMGNADVSIYATSAISAKGIGGNATIRGNAAIDVTLASTFGAINITHSGNTGNVNVYATAALTNPTYWVSGGTKGNAYLYHGIGSTPEVNTQIISGTDPYDIVVRSTTGCTASLYLPQA